MTDNEAKGFIQGKIDCMNKCDVFDCKNTEECDNCEYCYSQGNFGEQKNAFEMTITALEEIQQYRAIGTVSEFRELKEKATAKKPIYSDFDENEDEEIIPYKAVCPVCGYEFEFGTWNDVENHHCECGQRMLWD